MDKFQAQIKYGRDYLEPQISAETIDYHHGKHHQGYAKNLNALANGTKYESMSLCDVIVQSRGIDPKIFNNAAQLFNHDFYWNCLSNSPSAPSGKLSQLIEQQFGDFATFQTKYIEHANSLFGSGWSWVVLEQDKLQFVNTSNAETPIGTSAIPVCVIDLWEHAYYIDFRNDRAAYIDRIVKNCINWDFCSQQIAS